MILEIIIGVLALMLYIYYSLTKNRNYWADRGVPNTGFKFLWGDSKDFVQQKKALHEFPLEVYNRFPGERYVGCWDIFGLPILMIRNDFELIKSIWIKDFDYFQIGSSIVKDHSTIWPASRIEKLMLSNLQSTYGDKWKDLRFIF